jgi:hypothetical protein
VVVGCGAREGGRAPHSPTAQPIHRLEREDSIAYSPRRRASVALISSRRHPHRLPSSSSPLCPTHLHTESLTSHTLKPRVVTERAAALEVREWSDTSAGLIRAAE